MSRWSQHTASPPMALSPRETPQPHNEANWVVEPDLPSLCDLAFPPIDASSSAPSLFFIGEIEHLVRCSGHLGRRCPLQVACTWTLVHGITGAAMGVARRCCNGRGRVAVLQWSACRRLPGAAMQQSLATRSCDAALGAALMLHRRLQWSCDRRFNAAVVMTSSATDASMQRRR